MKNKWLDNFGKANNANDSKVSTSEDFVGLGYNTEGRNYSPAWGGQFQIGGKLNPISPTQQIQQAVQPTPTVPYLQTKDPAEFYKSWIQSPEYERRLKATGYSDVPNRWNSDKLSEIEKVKKERLGLLENIQPIEYDPSKRSEAIIDYYDGSTINVNPSDYKTFSKQSVEAHEIAHVATPQSTMGGNEFGIFMGSMLPSKKPVVSGVQGSKEREASKEAVGDFEHLQKPWEAKADLDALRFMMYDKGIYDITKGKKFTETDFEKVKQSFGKERVFKRFTDKMGKENFVKLMNTIALADDQEEAPIAMGGMSIPGSVGFSYARVAGAAPSKGKYAKKTMASAQNGIMSPMLLARNVLNYFYPSEEAAPTVSAAPVEYKKGLTNELLQRQAYKESTFNPAAVSPAGYKGLTQIGEGVLKDYSNKKGGKKLDPFNPEDAVELQKFAMDDLYNASFINKPNQPDSVRIAKTLAAYNWGRGNLANYLNEQKSKGVDIYDSYDWLNNLPKETSDYVNKILLQEDPSFNKNYKKASTNPKYEEVTSLYDQKKFGGDIPSAQNGQEMRFYQNGLDWKPKSMQPGGNIERISINDPRYPELYKNRQVGSYYDGAYSLPDLDEVVVTGKDERLKEAMYEGSNKFGMNALGLMSAPQVVMMEALTGKQQTPSEAFGFQQTGGWLDSPTSFGKNLGNLVMDAALDPINLLGVGVADDVARSAARVIANKPIQQFGRAAGSSDKVVFDLMDESIDPFGEALKNVKIDNTPSPFAEEVRKEALAYQALTRDPRYLERVKRIDKDFGSKLEPLLESFNRNQPEGSEKFLPFNISIEDRISSKGTNSPNELDPLGVSALTESGRRKFEKSKWALPWPFNIGSDKLKIDPATDRYITIGEKSHMQTGEPVGPTVHHELKHHWTNAMAGNQNYDYRLGLKNLIAPRSKVVTDPKDVTANQNYKYFSYGTEVDAHLMTNLRDEMVKRGYLKDHFDELSEEKLNDFLFEERDYRGVGEYFNPSKPMVANKSKFVDFFNTYGLPSTVVGGVLGGQAIDQQKNGGITKDNQGYWNPDNWGKPVEIGSNNITMEGVNQPLLGVSDTGDTKLMKPGKNYKFKGRKVTEFPVAKDGAWLDNYREGGSVGINQLDAQPMKKLNQLLNFTNNPDKDNWLDKYN